MKSISIFWLVWMILALAALRIWFGIACPSATCNGMLLAIETLELIPWVLGWIVIGVLATLVLIPSRKK